ncbi:MAG TPA: acyl-CoA dehydratase activase [Desulfitobacteriaceae bacterium]|nr:acyl-CoA dehydratase activase [Desulfitobacteriaceae bacterium]
MRAIGVCVGAATITRVDLEKTANNPRILNISSKIHEGNIKKTFQNLIGAEALKSGAKIVLTGRKYKNLLNLTSISEPEAIEYAYSFLKDRYGPANYISCAGAETFTTYELDASDKIINIFTGNKCASGTGEFFLQQIKRMDIGLAEAVGIENAAQPYALSGRCSVFCKSDCTHALNKGQDKASIIIGLCGMMAERILEHLGENAAKKVWLIGGCSKNKVMVSCLKKHISQLVIPEEAAYFEALGCALWGLENETAAADDPDSIFLDEKKSFAILPELQLSRDKVEFKELNYAGMQEGDQCILGLDVGSTTTKAVLVRVQDNAILASVYRKTLGDPVKAARNCYSSLKNDLKCRLKISGLGVTGSGRQIAALHALTDSVYNEISAHATAAVYFDSEVDTIFEIGGQDAKYTHIINGVPCDYAMNEACSAGTGSFLEESAAEFLNIDVKNIQDIALEGSQPPDFNDQCAAFIGSDIKTALQENIQIRDVVAGLVYSICKNYLNRVKGDRFVGRKIFMQGGVCYNQAIPVAMASLLDRRIIVPPEPGLMGCFGVALMVKDKLQNGLTKETAYDLDRLINRDVRYADSFICQGGNTECDRKCQVLMIEIEGRKYPFGGICGKYSTVKAEQTNSPDNNLVRLREEMIYGDFSYNLNPNQGRAGKIAVNKSLLVNTLFPLYYNFFHKLGLEVVMPGKADLKEKTVVKKDSAFCYPVNLAHEYFKELLKLDVDYIFLPHVKGMYVENSIPISLTCPLVQGESYYLKTTFGTGSKKILSPVLDFAQGYEHLSAKFSEIGQALGFDKNQALSAYRYACDIQNSFFKECKETGRDFLSALEKTGEKAVVLFGRPYNALVKDGNMGIPEKFASRGYKIIPYDFLPLEEEEPQVKMYWSMGQMILKAAKLVARHPQLFGTYITNFSCGPDSFIISYFRNLMGDKPSLTLELDSHTADAGIDTRIDAFIDVMLNYQPAVDNRDSQPSKPAKYDYQKKLVKLASGEYVPLTDPRIKVLIPSMGYVGSRYMAAAFRKVDIDAEALLAPTENELHLGRANSTCKECLPLILTVGSLLNYLNKYQDETKTFVYFMPEAPDPCRFGQYHVYTENLMQKLGIANVALLTLSSGNSYGGLGATYKLRAWISVVASDVLQDIYSAILVLAGDQKKALEVFDQSVRLIERSIEQDSWAGLKNTLQEAAAKLAQIPLQNSLVKTKKVTVVGEIYVRRDEFSKQGLVEKLAQKGIITKIAPIAEWVYYCDYLVKNDLSEEATFKDKVNLFVEYIARSKIEKAIKSILAKSNLFEYHVIEIEKIIDSAKELISPRLSGEAILTIGTSISEIIDHVDGIIAIGPFGCMPSRISEAVLSQQLSRHKQQISLQKLVQDVLEVYPHLPFLNIEADGNTFPQLIDIKLEAFALQVKRVNELITRLKREGA